MNKIRVIDLLNKIANGEEVPKKFKYQGLLWEYDKEYEMWFYYNKPISVYRFDTHYLLGNILNDTVEIIEDMSKENKKIEKLELLQFSDLIDMPNDEIMVVIKDNRNKINEIIDKVNGE